MDPGTACSWIVLAPLSGALLAGLGGRWLGRSGAHWVTILGVGVSVVLSLLLWKRSILDGAPDYSGLWYSWGFSGGIHFQLGFLVDALSVTLMLVVSLVSWIIHIYTIGYMRDDPGYQRFFSYISLFTFAMLMLVMSNNFLQLFFGWEAVGLVSYLLIGFWHKRDSAVSANLKAFLVNRVGDFAFLLGLAAILGHFHSFAYADVFAAAAAHQDTQVAIMPGVSWSLPTLICLCLFIGAMGKSAQVPLHVWLPDSMEGPTPISALIHAATMVTAGIFMVARMSPLFELSASVLNFILIVGALTALSMGLLGLVQHDIKRVIAYSTLSQLGYMTAALGASAYAAAIFHLVTHAFFKALLFLAAGSVIIGMHHEQDMRKMGDLYKKMPITWFCCLIGSMALVGVPGTSGFFSKDAIIEAVHLSRLPGASFAWLALISGVFVTACYSFRLFFITFHGPGKMDLKAWIALRESPWVVTLPLCALAVPSLVLGALLVQPMLFGGYFGDSIRVLPENDVLTLLAGKYDRALDFFFHAFVHPQILLLIIGGVWLAWYCFLRNPDWLGNILGRRPWSACHQLLVRKYGFDDFNQGVVVAGSLHLGRGLWRLGDRGVIDRGAVHGLADLVRWTGAQLRTVQSGYLYHYALIMIATLLLFMGLLVYISG